MFSRAEFPLTSHLGFPPSTTPADRPISDLQKRGIISGEGLLTVSIACRQAHFRQVPFGLVVLDKSESLNRLPTGPFQTKPDSHSPAGQRESQSPADRPISDSGPLKPLYYKASSPLFRGSHLFCANIQAKYHFGKLFLVCNALFLLRLNMQRGSQLRLSC